jgi:hypothetical protein
MGAGNYEGRKNNCILYPKGLKVRYLKLDQTPERISEIIGYKNGKSVNRKNWRVSNLFSPYWKMQFTNAGNILQF